MKSKVYFTAVKNSDDANTVSLKQKSVLENSGILDFLRKDNKTVVKMHFGEDGNTGFVKPDYVRIICDEIKKKGSSVSLSDTNALYRGRRTNSRDHLNLAVEHGFTKESTGAENIIPDDTKKENIADVKIGKKFIDTAKVARIFVDADSIIAVTHFKGQAYCRACICGHPDRSAGTIGQYIPRIVR